MMIAPYSQSHSVLDPVDLDNMRHIAEAVRCAAHSVGYGMFHGGDPRDFFPAPEWATPEQREAHERACAAWEAGIEVELERRVQDGEAGCARRWCATTRRRAKWSRADAAWA